MQTLYFLASPDRQILQKHLKLRSLIIKVMSHSRVGYVSMATSSANRDLPFMKPAADACRERLPLFQNAFLHLG